jgi:chaperonin cofactor prefoldin
MKKQELKKRLKDAQTRLNSQANPVGVSSSLLKAYDAVLSKHGSLDDLPHDVEELKMRIATLDKAIIDAASKVDAMQKHQVSETIALVADADTEFEALRQQVHEQVATLDFKLRGPPPQNYFHTVLACYSQRQKSIS